VTLAIRKITPEIGAEITGLDLSRPIDEDTRAALNKALADHVVLVFPGQDFTRPQFRDAVLLFGPPKYQLLQQYLFEDTPEIGVVTNRDRDTHGDGKVLIRGHTWHTDHSNEEVPAKATALYGIEIPKSGGDTMFCNCRAAYDALDPAMRARVDALKAIHTYNSRFAPRKLPKRTRQEEARSPDVVHPVARTNPDNGRKAIYVNPIRIEHFVGMEIDESQALLNELIDFMSQDRFVYRHKWRKGDMVIWDNRQALHQATTDYDHSEYRELYRMMVEGDRPV
jgi:taurine dioxygenase